MDELVHTPVERAVFLDLCAKGYAMEYLECKGADHTNGGLWSMGEQIAWATDRFAGKPLSNPCVVTEPVCCSVTNAGPCAGQ